MVKPARCLYRYSSCCSCSCCSCWGDLFKTASGSIVGMKSGRNVLQVNKHQFTESDLRFDVILSRWRLWRHSTQQSAATWWVNTKHLCSSVCQFLIYSTFVHLLSHERRYDRWHIGNGGLVVWWLGRRTPDQQVASSTFGRAHAGLALG